MVLDIDRVVEDKVSEMLLRDKVSVGQRHQGEGDRVCQNVDAVECNDKAGRRFNDVNIF